MKKLTVLVLVLVLVFSLSWIACTDDDDDSEITGDFWAQNYSDSKFYQIKASRLAENSRCEVWVEKGSGVTEAKAKNIADEYANVVYVKNMNTFGYTINDSELGNVNTMEIAHYYVTGTTSGAKLTILLLDIKDGYKKQGDPYVGGFFASRDFYSNEDLKNNGYADIKSNEREMIYIDTYPSEPGSGQSYETLAHEMQHLMNFTSSSIFRRNKKVVSLMDTWVDEGLSAAAQWVYSGKQSEERLNWYNKDPSGLIKKGNNFYIWNNYDKENNQANLDDYATVYLFFQYIRLQSDKPGDIYRNIEMSQFSDYQAVINAESINSSHKGNWQLLLRDWHAANYTNNADGLYGYKNDPALKTVKAPMFSGGNTVSLFPGEGVYSKTTTAETVPTASGSIKYAGLGSAGLSPNESTGYANGARLTYNINTDMKGTQATGSTTGIAANTGISITDGSSSLQVLDKFPYSFQVDADYFNRRNRNVSILDNIKILNFDKSKVERVFIDE